MKILDILVIAIIVILLGVIVSEIPKALEVENNMQQERLSNYMYGEEVARGY